MVIIGASTGGPGALNSLISSLKTPHPAMIIIQHMPVGFTTSFAERLNQKSSLDIKLASQDDRLSPNKIFVAPSGYHLTLEEIGSKFKINLSIGERVNGVCPSLDPTIISASYFYEENLKIVILSGMGSDGLEGTRYA